MPELPEVETICRGLDKAITGLRIVGVRLNRQGLRKPFPTGMAAKLEGRKITAIERRAKYALIRLEGDFTLILHFGMSGRVHLLPCQAKVGNGGQKNHGQFIEPGAHKCPPDKHDHLILQLSAAQNDVCPILEMRLNDPRRFGLCDLVANKDLPKHDLFKNLGPEPFSESFTPAYLGKVLSGKNTPLKSALLDQRVLAGLGNIYVCEALFRAGLSPLRRAKDCNMDEVRILVKSIKIVLAKAIDAGGSSIKDYVTASGELGYFQNQFAVYGKEGNSCKNCTCDVAKTGGVCRITQAGRSSFYCKTKQH